MIPQHYTVEEGKLYAGEFPGDLETETAKARLRSLISMGVRTFIDLTTEYDRMKPYEGLLAELEGEAGGPLRRISMPITDVSVPDAPGQMSGILTAIRESIRHAPAVYVHCWGGIGRTGTVVGCWLREHGYDPDAALEQVQHLYSTHMPKSRLRRESPETREQMNYVRFWEPPAGAWIRTCPEP
jgi:hypothetical protein